MNIKDRFKAFLNPQNNVMRINDSQFLDLLGVNGGSVEAINEVTYFTCLKILSETLGKLSFNSSPKYRTCHIRIRSKL